MDPDTILAYAALITALALLIGAGATAFVTIRASLFTHHAVAEIVPLVRGIDHAINRRREGDPTISDDVTALRDGMEQRTDPTPT